LPGEEDGCSVYGDRIVNLPGVAAGHGDGERYLPDAAMLEYPAITFGEAGKSQAETA
jgi:hypothetical protein